MYTLPYTGVRYKIICHFLKFIHLSVCHFQCNNVFNRVNFISESTESESLLTESLMELESLQIESKSLQTESEMFLKGAQSFLMDSEMLLTKSTPCLTASESFQSESESFLMDSIVFNRVVLNGLGVVCNRIRVVLIGVVQSRSFDQE